MKTVVTVVVVISVVAALGASSAFGEGIDPNARATFVGPIHVSGAKATLRVRYQCSSAEHLWVSAKETASGVSATKLQKEGSSKTAAAWWDSHRNRFVCNGRPHTATFTIDKVEKGKKGQLVDGVAWVQFCLTKGSTEANTKLMLSKSGWVHVVA